MKINELAQALRVVNQDLESICRDVLTKKTTKKKVTAKKITKESLSGETVLSSEDIKLLLEKDSFLQLVDLTNEDRNYLIQWLEREGRLGRDDLVAQLTGQIARAQRPNVLQADIRSALYRKWADYSEQIGKNVHLPECKRAFLHTFLDYNLLGLPVPHKHEHPNWELKIATALPENDVENQYAVLSTKTGVVRKLALNLRDRKKDWLKLDRFFIWCGVDGDPNPFARKSLSRLLHCFRKPTVYAVARELDFKVDDLIRRCTAAGIRRKTKGTNIFSIVDSKKLIDHLSKDPESEEILDRLSKKSPSDRDRPERKIPGLFYQPEDEVFSGQMDRLEEPLPGTDDDQMGGVTVTGLAASASLTAVGGNVAVDGKPAGTDPPDKADAPDSREEAAESATKYAGDAVSAANADNKVAVRIAWSRCLAAEISLVSPDYGCFAWAAVKTDQGALLRDVWSHCCEAGIGIVLDDYRTFAMATGKTKQGELVREVWSHWCESEISLTSDDYNCFVWAAMESGEGELLTEVWSHWYESDVSLTSDDYSRFAVAARETQQGELLTEVWSHCLKAGVSLDASDYVGFAWAAEGTGQGELLREVWSQWCESEISLTSDDYGCFAEAARETKQGELVTEVWSHCLKADVSLDARGYRTFALAAAKTDQGELLREVWSHWCESDVQLALDDYGRFAWAAIKTDQGELVREVWSHCCKAGIEIASDDYGCFAVAAGETKQGELVREVWEHCRKAGIEIASDDYGCFAIAAGETKQGELVREVWEHWYESDVPLASDDYVRFAAAAKETEQSELEGKIRNNQSEVISDRRDRYFQHLGFDRRWASHEIMQHLQKALVHLCECLNESPDSQNGHGERETSKSHRQATHSHECANCNGTGTDKPVSICPDCDGKLSVECACVLCAGTGRVEATISGIAADRNCLMCRGSGLGTSLCKTCHGKGVCPGRYCEQCDGSGEFVFGGSIAKRRKESQEMQKMIMAFTQLPEQDRGDAKTWFVRRTVTSEASKRYCVYDAHAKLGEPDRDLTLADLPGKQTQSAVALAQRTGYPTWSSWASDDGKTLSLSFSVPLSFEGIPSIVVCSEIVKEEHKSSQSLQREMFRKYEHVTQVLSGQLQRDYWKSLASLMDQKWMETMSRVELLDKESLAWAVNRSWRLLGTIFPVRPLLTVSEIRPDLTPWSYDLRLEPVKSFRTGYALAPLLDSPYRSPQIGRLFTAHVRTRDDKARLGRQRATATTATEFISTVETEDAENFVKGQSGERILFITGKSGTGKTTLINHLSERILDGDPSVSRNPIFLQYTGIEGLIFSLVQETLQNFGDVGSLREIRNRAAHRSGDYNTSSELLKLLEEISNLLEPGQKQFIFVDETSEQTTNIQRSQQWEYKGHTCSIDYEPGDPDPDDFLVFHRVEKPDGEVVTADISRFDYQRTTLDLWIDAGYPKRAGGGPLSREDLETMISDMGSFEVPVSLLDFEPPDNVYLVVARRGSLGTTELKGRPWIKTMKLGDQRLVSNHLNPPGLKPEGQYSAVPAFAHGLSLLTPGLDWFEEASKAEHNKWISHGKDLQKQEVGHETRGQFTVILSRLKFVKPKNKSLTMWDNLEPLTRIHLAQLDATFRMYSNLPHTRSEKFPGINSNHLESYCEAAAWLAAERCTKADEDEVRKGWLESVASGNSFEDIRQELDDWELPSAPKMASETIATYSFGILFVRCLYQAMYHTLRAKVIDPDKLTSRLCVFINVDDTQVLHVWIRNPGAGLVGSTHCGKAISDLGTYFLNEASESTLIRHSRSTFGPRFGVDGHPYQSESPWGGFPGMPFDQSHHDKYPQEWHTGFRIPLLPDADREEE